MGQIDSHPLRPSADALSHAVRQRRTDLGFRQCRMNCSSLSMHKPDCVPYDRVKAARIPQITIFIEADYPTNGWVSRTLLIVFLVV